MSIKDYHWTWHKKLGHASLRLILKLNKHHLNGVLERENKSLQEITRTMSNNHSTPPSTYRLKLLMFVLKRTAYELWKGYSKTSKAYRYKVYNSRTLTMEESIHIKFNKSKPNKKLSKLNESLAYLDLAIFRPSKVILFYDVQKDDKFELIARNYQMKSYHLEQQVMGNVQDRVRTSQRSRIKNKFPYCKKIEQKNVDKALMDDG
ncbi:hypothetical protein CR513_40085, partial [Mucuna pruriens]